MTAIARPDVLDRWKLQPCHDAHIASLEHARLALTIHGAHGGCAQYMRALAYGSAVLA